MRDLSPGQSSRLPAYLRISKLLQERIISGVYRPDEFLPPERDLAREFHASRQTIRMALEAQRREGLVVPEQGRGTRVIARSVGRSETAGGFNLIALVIYGISREGSAAILQGSQEVMRRDDHHLIVAETSSHMAMRAKDEALHLQTLIEKGIAGFIIYAEPTDQNRALLSTALQRNVQVVQIDRFLPGLECDYVGVDNRAAAIEMVDHLWRLGHRRIAFYSFSPEASTAEERRLGYQAGLKKHGVDEADQIIATCSQPETIDEEVGETIDRWISMPDPPTAIFAINDGLALRVIKCLRKRNARIPDDIAVVGFDDQFAASIVSPPLTTIHQPFRALGETAAKLLLDRLTGRYDGPPRRVQLPTRLVIRESCSLPQSASIHSLTCAV